MSLYTIVATTDANYFIVLYCDSEATMFRAFNKIYNGKSRHISLKHAYIKQLISEGVITIIYVWFRNNLVGSIYKSTREKNGEIYF